MKLGKVQTINLTNKRGGKSSDSYLRLMVLDETGKFDTLIMTKNDFVNATGRAEKNPRDTVDPGFWDKFYKLFS
jgi:hypothetical protein